MLKFFPYSVIAPSKTATSIGLHFSTVEQGSCVIVIQRGVAVYGLIMALPNTDALRRGDSSHPREFIRSTGN